MLASTKKESGGDAKLGPGLVSQITRRDWADGVTLTRSLVRWMNQICAAITKNNSSIANEENGEGSSSAFAQRCPDEALRMLLTVLHAVCGHLDAVYNHLDNAEIFVAQNSLQKSATENLWPLLCSAMVVLFAPTSTRVFDVSIRLNGLRTLQVEKSVAMSI